MKEKAMIRIGGALNLLCAVFHLCFWTLFDWADQLPALSDINAAIMQLLNIAVICTMGLFTYLSLRHTDELLTTQVGATVVKGIIFLYVVRAVAGLVIAGATDPSQLVVSGFVALLVLLYGVPLATTRRRRLA